VMHGGSRRVLYLDPASRRHIYRRLVWRGPSADDPADYTLLWGEALCQYILRRQPDALIIARGPLSYLSGNKATVGYISPITGVPHYSFVGGQGFAALVDLGLDAIVFAPSVGDEPPSRETAQELCIHITGRAPSLEVHWLTIADIPSGQRSATHWLVDRVLEGQPERGSVFVTGEAARYGYHTANLAVEGLYHAGRGGAGYVFGQFARALVLEGEPMTFDSYLGGHAEAFRRLRQREIQPRLQRYCERLSNPGKGTIAKLWRTGRGEAPTLPARNAQTLGYKLAALGSAPFLNKTRDGQTGCRWCQVNCRHWHWVPVDYTSTGRDQYLDDFEPTYALFAMLDLGEEVGARDELIEFRDEVEQRLIIPIEQLGADVIDLGIGLSALFYGIEHGLIPESDLAPYLRQGPCFGNLDKAVQVVSSLRAGSVSPVMRALGDGAQALAARYPALQPYVFTSGPNTMANPGHANALWTFMMAFSRFFGHYSGQFYKISGSLDDVQTKPERHALFHRVVRDMIQRESYICLGNALSMCSFTFVIFSEDGEGQRLASDDLLRKVLAVYGIELQVSDLAWFAQSYWVQSMMMKAEAGWAPPEASDFPLCVYALLAQSLNRSVEVLRMMMGDLIDVWKSQTESLLVRHGYEVPWS
jgi:aldehyde:ferredoxin oxidoreductase